MNQRGRPRSFDHDVVVEKAMKAFWERGYEMVSMDLLCELANLSKPSFYNAFTNKEQLFLVCLKKYQEKYAKPLLSLLLSESNPKIGIKKLLNAAVERFQDSKVPSGCLIMTGALEAKGKTKAIDKELDRLQAEILEILEKYFENHVSKKSAHGAAEFLLSQLYAFAMLSKTNPKIFDFDALTENALRSISALSKLPL